METAKTTKMEDSVEIKGGGLICDNPKCDFEDATIKIDDYAKAINKFCPRCGENLLTQQDFEDFTAMYQKLKILAKSVPHDENSSEERKTVYFHTHNGNVTISEEK